mgnify:CR=1 FL=1
MVLSKCVDCKAELFNCWVARKKCTGVSLPQEENLSNLYQSVCIVETQHHFHQYIVLKKLLYIFSKVFFLLLSPNNSLGISYQVDTLMVLIEYQAVLNDRKFELVDGRVQLNGKCSQSLL